jgi:thiol peroxidase
MTLERKGLISFAGVDQTIVGPDIEIGQVAPDFIAVGQDWNESNPIRETEGMVRLFAAVPSLETSVCDKETRFFNERADDLGDDVRIYVISTDTPFTQRRWCGAADVDKVVTLSDHLHTDFGTKYGCLIKEKRLLRRAVFVIDRQNKVAYVQYLPVLGEEPDYEKLLEAISRVI